MNKEGQLKELAEITKKYRIGCNLRRECNSECEKCMAEALFEAGYRKKGGLKTWNI